MALEKYFLTNLIEALALLLLFLISPAMAKDFDPQGGAGGSYFKSTCPAGKYLIGTNGNYGFVVDHISLICGAVNSDGTVGDIWQETVIHGGAGGGPLPKTRCENSEIIHGMGLLTGDMPPHTVIRLIIFNCVSTTTDARHNLDIGSAPFFPTMQQDCPAGEAAVGIQGRSGSYIDAAGLLCGPFTKSAGPVIPPPIVDPCLAAATDDDKAICAEHNRLRAMHGVPALTWDTALASNAQVWVNGCHTDKDANDNVFFCHQQDCGPGDPYGENLSFHYGDPPQTPAGVVDGWYCEINVYDFDNPVLTGGVMFGCAPADNPNKVDGHFTQVVWRDSAKLGCAKNTCSLSGNSGPLWACEYAPPGNFNAGNPGVLQHEVPRLQGLVANPAPASIPRQTATAIISDVDLYDVPGGVGRVIGMLKQGQKYPLVGCRADDWCQLPVGWVWGSFIMRSHNRSWLDNRSEMTTKH